MVGDVRGDPGSDVGAALRFHEATKHSPESVRASARPLDWANKPHPFKEYAALEPEPLSADLERLLRVGAGVVKAVGRRGPGRLYFRTYSSAGALYPIEVYAATRSGLHHFHPGQFALRPLRRDDARAALATAAAEPLLARAAVVLVLTGTIWRTAWKYGARGYRHLFWDGGTMLANLLALAESQRVYVAFADPGVNRLVGADGKREAALCLLSAGSDDLAPPLEQVPALDVEAEPLSKREEETPEAYRIHALSELPDPDAVASWRRVVPEPEPAWPFELPVEDAISRRISVRDFTRDAVPQEAWDRVLAYARAPIAGDWPPLTELWAIVHAIDGVTPGLHRGSRRLELVRAGSFRLQTAHLLLDQPFGAYSAATVFLLCDLARAVSELGDRGYRCAQLEAGIRAGRLQLGAFAEGLGATASTFYDDAAARFLTGETGLQPMLAVALGRAARR